MKPFLGSLVLGAVLAMTSACQAEHKTAQAADSVKIENPYARAVPPGQANSGAFMTFVNSSDVDHSVKSAASPVADKVELHTHTNNNGVMEMRQVPQIDVPAKGRAELKPGGFHIMLLGLKQAMKAGETAEITVTFEDGSSTTVKAPIQDVTPPAAGQMGGMQH
ncbi:MAG: hypothetical protein RI964_2015 [Pseudomonadota bacterium]|jgi:copper(I)-binding protein